MILKNHPKGLAAIFMIEMWERFGFYIMSAIYVLYMDKVLHFDDGKKGTLYGLFFFASYIFPLLGGWLGDRIIGTIRTIRGGAWCMALGYIFLALSGPDRIGFFYTGLLLIAFGTGIFKVNMTVSVGRLYTGRKELQDAGYNIYYMSVNLGATIGPLTANLLGYLYNDYHLSFWAAAIGMLLAILILEISKARLAPAEMAPSQRVEKSTMAAAIHGREFWARCITLIALFCIASLFWIPFYQNGMALTLFADRSTVALSWLRPEIYVMFNAFFILLLTPIVLALFTRLQQRNREPVTPTKILLGLLIMSVAMLVMALACILGGNKDVPMMSPFWLISTYLVITVAEILISPMGQSYVSKVAPPQIQGVMMGGWFAATALGALSSGLFGRWYSQMPHHTYFMLLAGISATAAVLLLTVMKYLRRFGT